VKDPGQIEFAERGVSRFFQLRTAAFQQAPTVDALQFPQLREPRRHRERIAGKRPGLIDRPERRKLIHDFGTPAEGTNR